MDSNELLFFFGDDSEANLQLADPVLVNFYKDLENRTYWIDSEITTDTLELVQYILRWNREDIGKPIEERQPIKIIFNSPGGSLDIEETLVAIIELSKTPIWGFAIGQVASAASLIYLSCHKRFATKAAYWVFHQGSGVIQGNYGDMSSAMDDYKKQIDKLVKAYSEKTKFTEEEVNNNIKQDWYVRFPLALEKEVTQEIIEDLDLFF